MEIAQKEWLGHPKGLFTLFFTEMWERFSYYGMRVLLVLYMVNHLFVSIEQGATVWGFETFKTVLEVFYGPLSNQAMSSAIYGLYTGLVYFTPLFGGLIADRYIGQRRSVYVGGFLMAIGHFLMAIESLFLPALFFLIIGNGFFKPNISTQVGGLYSANDSRRDRAYSIFYMGINLGAFFSPLICGTLGQKVGWHWGFGAAGVGMLISLLVYHFGGKHLPLTEHKESTQEIKAKSNAPMTRKEWLAVGALGYLCFLNIVFWAVYEQQGNTLQLWADQNTNWNILGWEMPSTWYGSFNPMFIFIFTPLLTLLWGWQNKRRSEPGSVAKMAIGCFLAGIALVIMYFAAKVVGDGRGSVMWLVVSTFVLTIGEIYLSPIGLSLVTKVAPVKIVSTMMGMWLMSSFFGNILCGHLGMFYEKMGKDNFFMMLTVLGFGAGVAFFISLKPINKGLGAQV
jgi:amino acid/peptide transporter (Peptide:H+ symporter), bacterial